MSLQHSSSRPFISSSIEWRGAVDAAMIVGLIGSWLGLLGRLHWFLDLFSHWRWQYLGFSLLAVVWSLWQNKRRMLVCTVLTLLLNAALIGQLALTGNLSKARLAKDFHLRVLSFNVLTSNPNTDGVLDYLRQSEADVIMLMEVDATWARLLEPLTQTHPHHRIQSRGDNFGIAIFSRLPLDGLEIVEISEAEVPSVDARLTINGRQLAILGTHTLPPMGKAYTTERDQQLTAIAEHVKASHTPTLVIGDLNASPWSHGMDLLQAGGTLGFRSIDPPWSPTWYAVSLSSSERTNGKRVSKSRPALSLFSIPIDHALCSQPLVITSRSVGPELGSDHRPLIVDVAWEE
jgi:endonuclease/exonuclease/phosphatase (EEP) superfamily protein YafD